MKGFFEDALPQLDPDRRFCFVHIDADLYSSVLCALEQLYDRVVAGGVIAIDDFFHPGQGPARATAEFFNSRGLTPLYHVGFPYSVFVIKEDWGRVLRSLDGNAYSLEWLRSDDHFLATLERSRKRARRQNSRARENCTRLLDTLRTDSPTPARSTTTGARSRASGRRSTPAQRTRPRQLKPDELALSRVGVTEYCENPQKGVGFLRPNAV